MMKLTRAEIDALKPKKDAPAPVPAPSVAPAVPPAPDLSVLNAAMAALASSQAQIAQAVAALAAPRQVDAVVHRDEEGRMSKVTLYTKAT